MSAQIRRLEHDEMAATSQVYRKIFDETFPWLVGLHTSEEDRRYFEGEVLRTERSSSAVLRGERL